MKTQIEQDADCSRASIYRVYNTGSISAKMIIPFAQRLNIDPYYLTGEIDENNGYAEETAERFLSDKGYSNLLVDTTAVEKPKKRAYNKKPKNQPENAAPREEIAEDHTATSDIKNEVEIVPSPVSEEVAKDDTTTLNIKSGIEIVTSAESEDDLTLITEDDMISILHSLFIRARVNKKAGERLEKIKHILVY